MVPLYLLGLTRQTNWRRYRGHGVTNCFMPRTFRTGTPLPIAPLMESQTPLSNLDEKEKRGGCPKRLETLEELHFSFLGP